MVISSPAVAGGIVYVDPYEDNVYALNATTGSPIWIHVTGNGGYSSPAVVGGVVYVGELDGTVYALSAATGALIWSFKTGSAVASSPAIAGGVVYVGSYDKNVYALSATTGTLIWSYTTGNYVSSSPAVADGKVYVGSHDYKIYAFGVGVHDVAVTNVASSKTVVCQGFSATINVTVANQGDYTETFNVTAYANATAIQTETLTLTSQDSTTLTFTWNTTGFVKGNYTISAYAEPVPGETYTADNNFTDGWVYVAMVGDINGDGKVDVKDVYAVAKAYGTSLEGPNPPGRTYNPNYDINGDDKVDVKDYYIVCRHYGEVDP